MRQLRKLAWTAPLALCLMAFNNCSGFSAQTSFSSTAAKATGGIQATTEEPTVISPARDPNEVEQDEVAVGSVIASGALVMRDKFGGYTMGQFSANTDGIDLALHPNAKYFRYYGWCRIGDCHTGSSLQWSGPRQTVGSTLYRPGGGSLNDSGFEVLDAQGTVLYTSSYNVCGEDKEIALPAGAARIRSHGSGVNGQCMDYLVSDSYLMYDLFDGKPDAAYPTPGKTRNCSRDTSAPSLCVTAPQ